MMVPSVGRSTLLMCLLALAVPGVARADTITFSAVGAGGLSPATAGVSDSAFWWADTSGTAPGSAATSSGFNPFPAFLNVVDGLGAGGGGSLLMSSEFTMAAGSTLNVSFKLLKTFFSFSNYDMTAPLGFAVLLGDGLPPVVLANITAENRNYFNNSGFLNTVPVSQTNFTAPSAGVTTTTTPGSGLNASLNGVHYGTVPGVGGFCGCYLDVTSTYTPGAGTYRLLFGIYDFTPPGTGSYPDAFRGALAVTDVHTVPEPTTLLLTGIGLAAGATARRLRRRAGQTD